MSAAPWFKLNVADFLASAIGMSPSARGVHITMLCLSWQTGSICLASAKQVLGFATEEPSRWQALLEEVLPHWEEGPDGRLRNAALEEQREECERLSNARREAGKRGGVAKAKQGQASAKQVLSKCSIREEKRRPEKRREETPPGGAALTRSGPHPEFIAWWSEEWERTRMGTAYAFQDAKDGAAVSWLLKRPEGVEEVKARALRLLESHDPWEAKNASLSMLRSRWNALAVEITKRTRQDENDEAFRRVAEKLAAKEMLNGRH